MRTAVLLTIWVLVSACSVDDLTAPEAIGPGTPALAVQRQITTHNFVLLEQNPCNLEPITFEVTVTFTTLLAGPRSSPRLTRSATMERSSGVGAFGTIYARHGQTNVVLHSLGDGSWGTSGRMDLVRGSAPGTSYLIITRIKLTRKGDLRLLVFERRCLGPGNQTF